MIIHAILMTFNYFSLPSLEEITRIKKHPSMFTEKDATSFQCFSKSFRLLFQLETSQ